MDSFLFFLTVIFSLLASIHVNGADDDVSFQQNYAPLWGMDHIHVLDQSREVQLTFDQSSGSGFRSNKKYGSGWFSMRIKMPQKDSTAVITTFYLQSDPGPERDEIDFELLGGTGNKELPYVVHTNIIIGGKSGREQEFYFWFDPTADFHNYTLLWNQQQMVFFVDNIPIRVFKNTTNIGGSYPTKAMSIIGTIWTGEWASAGKPVNWSSAPFEAYFRGFGISGCQTQNTNDPQCQSSNLWWNQQKYWTLDAAQHQQYENVRSKYLKYDYCNQNHSPECQAI